MIIDGMQLALGPLGWVGADQVLDLVAMAIFVWLLGFHVLLLPTVILEAVPVVEAFPMWTTCVITVIMLRRREARQLVR